MKIETAYKSKDYTAYLITTEYASAYSEKDFNASPAISFPLMSCFSYTSGKENFIINSNHILFEKGEIEFTVCKFPVFKKDVTLSIHFLNSDNELTDLFSGSKKPIIVQKRNLQTEILLRKLLPVAQQNCRHFSICIQEKQDF